MALFIHSEFFNAISFLLPPAGEGPEGGLGKAFSLLVLLANEGDP
jgi:hypothetical protein